MAGAVLAAAAVAIAALAHASRLPLAVFSHPPRGHNRIHLQLINEDGTINTAQDHYSHLADKLNDSDALAGLQVLYQVGNSEDDLPECGSRAVCTKVDLYGQPWIERQCRCKHGQKCPGPLTAFDGHTIVDKTRHYKLCDPVQRLPNEYFRDVTWTLLVSGQSSGNATTEHVVHCRCPRGAVAYLIKRQSFRAADGSTAVDTLSPALLKVTLLPLAPWTSAFSRTQQSAMESSTLNISPLLCSSDNKETQSTWLPLDNPPTFCS